MSKKLFFMLSLLVMLAIAVVGCSSDQAPSSEEVKEKVEEVKEQVEEKAEEEMAEVVEGCTDPLGCVTVAPGDALKIASALVVSGPNDSLGLDTQYGVEIAITQRGEVAGHEVELVAEDAQCSAEGGQTVATKIASDDTILGVVGHNCSSSCTPAAPIYNDAGITMISPSCTAPALTGEGSHVESFLRTAHNDNIQGRVMAEFVYNELGLRSAATIHDGSPYAEQLQQVFANVFTEMGGEITAQEAVNVGDTDMRPVLTSIATGEPELLYYPIFIAEGAFITTQAEEIAGLENTALAGADGMTSPDFIEAAGDASEGMYLSGPDLGFENDIYAAFLETYAELAGGDPSAPFHAHAYDASLMLFDAIEAVAQKDADGNTVIGRQALRDALYATQGLSGITGTISCDGMGDCADPQIAVNQVQSASFVPIYPSGEILGEMGDAEMAELPDLGGQTITIAMENAYLPFNYIDLETGEAAGWDYDFLAEMCNRLNCVPDYVEARWDGMIVAVSEGQFDMAADGITITDERAEIVDFSDGYINIEQRLLVRLDEDRFTEPEELAADPNLLIGTQIGTTNYNTAEELVGADRIQAFDDFGFAVQALLAGDVDAVVMDENAGQGYVGVNADKLKVVGSSLSSDQLGFIFPLGSDLVEPVNAAISSMKADGFLEEISTQYFSDRFTITYDDIGPGAYVEEEEEAAEEEAPAEEVELPDLGGQTITIAMENAYLPFNYIDLETGEAAGWDYDFLAEMCNRLNCVPDYVEARWDGMIVAVSEGQFDMAADGITITDERAEIVDFSDGYINIEQRLLVRLDEDRFTEPEELAADPNLLIGTQIGTTNYNTAEELVGADRIQAFDDFGFAVQALLAGDVDAVVMDENAGQGYVGVNADKLKVVGSSLSSDQLGFIFPLGSDLVEPVNAAISSMKADGFLEEISTQYFSDRFTITYDDIGPGAYVEEEEEAAEEEAPAEESAPAEEESEHAEDVDSAEANPFAPAAGKSKLYVFNELAEEITLDIASNAYKIAPGTPDDGIYIDLEPGKYTYTLSIPGGAANGEVELGPDQGWGFGVRGDGAVYTPILLYPSE